MKNLLRLIFDPFLIIGLIFTSFYFYTNNNKNDYVNEKCVIFDKYKNLDKYHLILQNSDGEIFDMIVSDSLYLSYKPGQIIDVKLKENENIDQGKKEFTFLINIFILSVGFLMFFLYTLKLYLISTSSNQYLK